MENAEKNDNEKLLFAAKIGKVITVDGVKLRLAHINTGKRRLTFSPVNPKCVIKTQSSDPIVAVTRNGTRTTLNAD
jgi:hypothetical protein